MKSAYFIHSTAPNTSPFLLLLLHTYFLSISLSHTNTPCTGAIQSKNKDQQQWSKQPDKKKKRCRVKRTLHKPHHWGTRLLAPSWVEPWPGRHALSVSSPRPSACQSAAGIAHVPSSSCPEAVTYTTHFVFHEQMHTTSSSAFPAISLGFTLLGEIFCVCDSSLIPS